MSATVPIELKQCDRFDINSAKDVEAMLRHLEEQGFAVISGAASVDDIEKGKDYFWKYMENQIGDDNINISRNNCSTWDYWVGSSSNGIISSPIFNHSSFCWHTRTLPVVKKAFSHLWETSDLIVSFDAGNSFRPWRINPYWVTQGNWWHVDQNSRKGKDREGKVCVQGLVSYYDVTEESGGLCLLPGSHIHHSALCERSSSAKSLHDYVYVEPNDPCLQGARAILPAVKAGDLILWDSRTIHCNTPGLTAPAKPATRPPPEEWKKNIPNEGYSVELLRLVSYVCMVPRSMATPQALESKKLGLLCSVPTSHWPQQTIKYLLEEDERKDPASFPDEVLRLSGYTEEEIRRIRNGRPSLCTIS